jgi:anti-sigma B factor antagonist
MSPFVLLVESLFNFAQFSASTGRSLIGAFAPGEAMPLSIETRIESGVVIVAVSGRLCFPEGALLDRVNELLASGHREFVVNLADVPYIDSFGLGQLITIWTSIRSKSGLMTLLRPTDHVLRLFQITKLDNVFHLAGQEDVA